MSTQSETINYKSFVQEIPDFPEKGVLFYDISPLIGCGAIFSSLIDEMAEPLRNEISKVVAFDARGFLFGGAIANQLGIGMVMLRKAGKLPGKTHKKSYDLEYGTSQLEIQAGAIQAGERVALVDDVIASGGTALAGMELVNRCGAHIVEFATVIDLVELGGSSKITELGIPVRSIIDIGAI